MNEELIKKIQDCQTMKELDTTRLEVVGTGRTGSFFEVQKVFIKQKNKIKRIPLRNRPEDYR